jgi:hypothetical protein
MLTYLDNDKNVYDIKVGTFATLSIGSDCYPYEVVEIKRNGRQLILREMKHDIDPKWKEKINITPGGFCGHCNNQDEQTWIITPDPNGKLIKANWAPKRNKYQVSYYTRLYFGHASYYYDYNF